MNILIDVSVLLSLSLLFGSVVSEDPRLNFTVQYADPCTHHTGNVKHLQNEVWAISTNYTRCNGATSKPVSYHDYRLLAIV